MLAYTKLDVLIYTTKTGHPANAGRRVVSVGYSFKQTKSLLSKKT